MEQDLFDFGTDPAPVEAGHDDAGVVIQASSQAEGEPMSRSVGVATPTAAMAASAGSVVEWREVPAALFLSWSEARQLAYCAARDEDSARRADTEAEAVWYRSRAEAYRS